MQYLGCDNVETQYLASLQKQHDTVYIHIIMHYRGFRNVETQYFASLQKQHDTVYTHIMMHYRGFRNVETQYLASLQQCFIFQRKYTMTHNKEKIIVHIDPDLKELVPGFLQHRRNDITAIQEALKQNDFENIRILGHSMKGSGAGYWFDTISEIGKSVEQAAKEKNSEEIQKQV